MRLQLNYNNEFTWCATVRRELRQPITGPTIGAFTVTPLSTVREFDVCIDSGLSMQGHVQRTVSRYFAVLRQLRTIRRQIPTTVSARNGGGVPGYRNQYRNQYPFHYLGIRVQITTRTLLNDSLFVALLPTGLSEAQPCRYCICSVVPKMGFSPRRGDILSP